MHDEPTLESTIHGFVPHGIVALNSEWIVDVQATATCTCLSSCAELAHACKFSWTKRVQVFVMALVEFFRDAHAEIRARSMHDVAIMYIPWLVRTCTHAHAVPYIHIMVTRSQPFTELIVELVRFHSSSSARSFPSSIYHLYPTNLTRCSKHLSACLSIFLIYTATALFAVLIPSSTCVTGNVDSLQTSRRLRYETRV